MSSDLSVRSCRVRLLLSAIVVVTTVDCVKASGFKPPPEQTNVGVIDGEDVVLERISIEATEDGSPFADGKRVRVTFGEGQRTFILELGAIDDEARAITPYGAPGMTATDGEDSDQIYAALSGSARIVDGDGSIGSSLTLEVEDVRLVHVCNGEELVVEHAAVYGEVVPVVLSEAELGVGGYVFSPAIEHPGYGAFPYVGLASGRAFTNSSGVDFFTVETGESCLFQRDRDGSHNFAILVHPGDLEGGATTLSLAASATRSFAFFRELSSTGAIIKQALAIDGELRLDVDTVSLEDGAAIEGELVDLTLQFLNAAGTDFSDEPPATMASMIFAAKIGEPVLP